MQRLSVELPGRSCPVLVGRDLDLATLLAPLIGDRPRLVVVDATVRRLHGAVVDRLMTGARPGLCVVPAGEAGKDLAGLATVHDACADLPLDRDGVVLALGGGATSDLAGFAAATWMRGVDWIALPTTLLAMLDAAIGGKTAIDHPRGKNLIGAFHQPAAVIADLARLPTIPDREYRAGLAEALKYGMALDPALLDWLDARWDALLAREPAALETCIVRCAALKAAVVQADERERGERALLNLGHSFGHALETWLGHGTWLHGEAVAAGLIMEGRVAVALGLYESAMLARIEALLARAGLPTAPPPGADLAGLTPLLLRDKKTRGATLNLTLPTRSGRASTGHAPAASALAAAFTRPEGLRPHG